MSDRAFWLAWSQVQGIGPTLLKRLSLHFGDLATAWQKSADALAEVDGIGSATARSIASHRSAIDPQELLQTHTRSNPHFLTPGDEAYPKLLFEIPDPPPVLYYRGNLSALQQAQNGAAIALVGTRSPTEYGRRWTRRLSATLANHGFLILSGLADGIDAEAHRSCLDMNGITIAVLGTGVDVVYPSKNRTLYNELTATGLALSEYPTGTQPDRSHFPRRNRIVSGLSRAVLLIEAPAQSGALITARLANEYGRDVFALPGSLDNPKAEGCLHLIDKGAQMILSEAHLLERLGELPPLDAFSEPEQLSLLDLELSADLQKVLEAMIAMNCISSETSASIDAIVAQTGLTAGSLLGSLMQLEMQGLVTQLPGMRYQILRV